MRRFANGRGRSRGAWINRLTLIDIAVCIPETAVYALTSKLIRHMAKIDALFLLHCRVLSLKKNCVNDAEAHLIKEQTKLAKELKADSCGAQPSCLLKLKILWFWNQCSCYHTLKSWAEKLWVP
ncbi:hypothetical protein chiPu_0019315 [Chiloscyllium punctatum]|uniref:Uncharacterized protein n=1 Tax=Chiloscyllium punctatum TaxID=137246 RepID=A0A401RRJ0_CHIPU|nr:hypothetical protein [Chiloscyllium punctatum]